MVGYIYLGPKNIEERVRKDISCYICTLIIDGKTPVIYDLNKLFILLPIVSNLPSSNDVTNKISRNHIQSLTYQCHVIEA